MKRLALLRHGKSSWGEPDLDDFDRPLNERGWKAARRMGRELEQRGVKFNVVIASPAARVRETIDGLTEKLKLKMEIRFEPKMYLASSETLFDMIRALPDEAHSVLLVGHNPGLQQLLLSIASGPKSLVHQVREKFPTAVFAEVELALQRWDEVEEGSGKISALILPKELD